MLSNEAWYVSCWLFMAQLIIIVWGYRPTWLFGKIDSLRNWPSRHTSLKEGIVKIVLGFVIVSAWWGFAGVLSTGYFSTLVFLSSSSLGGNLSSRDLLTVLLSGIGATAIIILLYGNNQKKLDQYSEQQEKKFQEFIHRKSRNLLTGKADEKEGRHDEIKTGKG